MSISTTDSLGLISLARDITDVPSLLRLAAVTVRVKFAFQLFLMSELTFLTLFGLVARAIQNVFFRPLHVVPGLRSFAATGWPIYRMYASGDAQKFSRDLHIWYGDMVRIRPNDVSFANAHVWSDVDGQKDAATAHSGPALLEPPLQGRAVLRQARRSGKLVRSPQVNHRSLRMGESAELSSVKVILTKELHLVTLDVRTARELLLHEA